LLTDRQTDKQTTTITSSLAAVITTTDVYA